MMGVRVKVYYERWVIISVCIQKFTLRYFARKAVRHEKNKYKYISKSTNGRQVLIDIVDHVCSEFGSFRLKMDKIPSRPDIYDQPVTHEETATSN